jgi:putative transcriptional regulator
VSEDFALTSHKFILQDIHSGEAPESYKLVLGHAGWTRGQLEKEIEHSDWLLQQTSKDFVFNTPDDIMWNQAAKALGVQTTQITGVGGVA